jgi:predicted nucleic acid-binding Zn ribbon protein
LTRPIPVFPAEAIPLGVAESICRRTGGQPDLVQLYGSLLVSRLNETQYRTAELADLEARRCAAHWSKAPIISAICTAPPPKPAREALQVLAQGETTSPDSRTRRWLERRRLIDAQGQLNIPVLGRWIVEEEL